MTPARLKLLSILAGLALGGLALLAWTQLWLVVVLVDGPSLDVGGDKAAPALAALGLATLALFGAISIAGPVFRIVLGALAVSIGGLVVYSGLAVLLDPVSGAESVISETTGLGGSQSLRDLVATVSPSGWAIGTVVIGVLLVALGVFVVVTSRRWPASGRKYQAVRLEPADGERTSAGDWDALSNGRDPT